MQHGKTEQFDTTCVRGISTSPARLVLYPFAVLLLLLSCASVVIAESGAIKRSTVDNASSGDLSDLISPDSRQEKLFTLKDDIGDLVKSINKIIDEPGEANADEASPSAAEEEPVEAPVIAPVKSVPQPPVVTRPVPEAEPATEKKANAKPEKTRVKTATKPQHKTRTVHAEATPNTPAQNSPVTSLARQTAGPGSMTAASYLKRDLNGKPLQDKVSEWACVEDSTTGLVWEVKSSDGGLRDKGHLYSWFNPGEETLKGVADGGRCKGDISCDTNAYIQAMNARKLCGHDDWRLPTKEEMQSLVSFNSSSDARINREYFPEALPSWYWTATSNSNNPDYAWYVLFRNGVSLNDLKSRPKHIRLVRDGDEA